MIDDPSDSKPSDWVDEAMIDDPEDKKPDNWDDDEDGEWEPPKIDNPDYKGDWYAKRIENPGSIFDNIFVTDSLDKAWEHADAHWAKISEGEKDAQDAYDKANAPPPAPDSDDDAGDADLDDEDGTDDEDL